MNKNKNTNLLHFIIIFTLYTFLLYMKTNPIIFTLSLIPMIYLIYDYFKNYNQKMELNKTLKVILIGLIFTILYILLSTFLVKNGFEFLFESNNQKAINKTFKKTLIPTIIITSILVPFTEEYFFRDLLIKGEKWIKIKYFLSNILFVFLHVGIHCEQSFSYILIALTFASIRVYTKNAKYSMIVHSIYNTICTIIILNS